MIANIEPVYAQHPLDETAMSLRLCLGLLLTFLPMTALAKAPTADYWFVGVQEIDTAIFLDKASIQRKGIGASASGVSIAKRPYILAPAKLGFVVRINCLARQANWDSNDEAPFDRVVVDNQKTSVPPKATVGLVCDPTSKGGEAIRVPKSVPLEAFAKYIVFKNFDPSNCDESKAADQMANVAKQNIARRYNDCLRKR